ncbi:MAG: glycoside hydrolase family 97 protein [Bacteroidales bacterium]|nr:glycoside hydrolase family 97 protein [Bacteroidales bacterium]
MKKLLLLVAVALVCINAAAQKNFTINSPDGKIEVNIVVSKEDVKYAVQHENTVVTDFSCVALQLNNGTVLGTNPKVSKTKTLYHNETINTPLYKKDEVKDEYNQIIISFKGNYSIIFRAYNDGVAYRFATKMKDNIIVKDETVQFNFHGDYTVYVPYVNARKGEGSFLEQQFLTSFENTYTVTRISSLDNERLIFLPMLVELSDGKKVVITEADLEDYPGMYLNGGNCTTSLKGIFAPRPKAEVVGGHNMLQHIVKERYDYIAEVDGTRDFPWRVIVISTDDAELANSDMVFKLASPARIADISWIKPGKVAWDWWNDWNISGVDFRSGVNNATYEYYIDFASKYGIEYVILDEGWAVNKKTDLFQVVPEIDLQHLVDYAADRNVGIVLWAGYAAMDKDMENVCKHYSAMGVKGFKVDFMDRDDQNVVDFYYRMAEIAAKYNLFVDFHGAYKPTGLSRTYPNVLNYEGVFGLEQAKWAPVEVDLVEYETTIPFIRMVAGQMDFTQGAMRNAIKRNYRPVYSEPMSQGTRCRQLAEYVIFESPFNMLCDNPTAYYKEHECTEYIAAIPTVWDETVVLDGRVGDYIIIARRSGDKWYIGGITDWTPRDITVDLSKLGLTTPVTVTIFKDGANADKVASDYKKTSVTVDGNIKISLASGGGFVIIL